MEYKISFKKKKQLLKLNWNVGKLERIKTVGHKKFTETEFKRKPNHEHHVVENQLYK